MRDRDREGSLKTPQFKNAMDWAKTRILGTGRTREFYADRWAGFQGQFLQQYLEKVRDKKLEPDDLSITNPDGLLRRTAETWAPGIGEEIRANSGVEIPSAPVAPSSAAATAPPAVGTEQNPYAVTTKEQRDALPPGAKYTRPDMPGSVFTREGKTKKPAATPVPEASM